MTWKSRAIFREKNYCKELNFIWNIYSKLTATLQELAFASFNNKYQNTILEFLAVKDPQEMQIISPFGYRLDQEG